MERAMAFPAREEFEVEIRAPVEVVADRLRERIEFPDSWRLFSFREGLFGQVEREGFDGYQVSGFGFRPFPVIRGRFEPGTSGTRVHVRVEPVRSMVVWLCIFFGFLGLMFPFVLIGVVVNGDVGSWIVLAGNVFMIFFLWGLIRWGFGWAVRRDRLVIESMLREIVGEVEGTTCDEKTVNHEAGG
jgi:hypothetical protein